MHSTRRGIRQSGPLVAVIIVAPALALAFSRPASGQPTTEDTVREALESAAILLQTGREHEALSALETVARHEPDNPWMLYYQGVAHLRLGNAYRSMERFDAALASLAEFGDDDPDLSANIRKYRRQARRQVFRISFETGGAYDTNVTFLGDNVSGVDVISGQADWRYGQIFRLDYAPVATETEAVSLGVRLGHTWHGDVNAFDYQDYGGYLRYARRLDENWRMGLKYDYDMTFLGNEPFLSAHAITPSLTYAWDPTASRFRPRESTVYYRLEARDFLFETDGAFDRDGFSNSVGIEQSFQLRPLVDQIWTWDLYGGYRFDSVATEGVEFDRLGHTFYVGVDIPLPNPLLEKDATFRFLMQWQIADYRENSLIDREGDARHDEIRIYSWSIDQPLIENEKYGDLILHALIHWTDSNSNVNAVDRSMPFTYNKVVYGFQLEWVW